MPWYAYVLYALFVIVCLLLIGVVLLQPGKGDIALFGGGSQTAFGPRGAQKPLERATFILAGLFLALAFTFSVPGILAPRSVASGIKDEPPAKKEEKPEEKKPEERKSSENAPAAGGGETPGNNNEEQKDAAQPKDDKQEKDAKNPEPSKEGGDASGKKSERPSEPKK